MIYIYMYIYIYMHELILDPCMCMLHACIHIHNGRVSKRTMQETWFVTNKGQVVPNPGTFDFTCPHMDLRAYIKDAVAYCKKHGLVKSLGLHL